MPNYRFRRSIHIYGPLSLNISKSGISFSWRNKIFGLTFGKHGVRFSSGLRGTGLSLIEYKNYKSIKELWQKRKKKK